MIPSSEILYGIIFAATIAFSSMRAGKLTASGAIAATIVGGSTVAAGGTAWALPLIVFFVLSSFALRGGRKARQRRRAIESSFAKTSRRDAMQVAANGGVATLCAVIAIATRDARWVYPFVGSLAAAAADTWATELGVLSRGATHSIVNLRRVEAGTSGGVSLIGTIAGMAGASTVALSSLIIPGIRMRDVILFVVAGMCGMLVDSFVGATLQQRRRCSACGRIVEGEIHCDQPTVQVGGMSLVTNDAVNLACTIVGGVVAAVIGWW